MKLNIIVAAALAVAISGSASAAIDEEQMASFEADCRSYAQEDGVADDQLEEYLAQCVQDLVSASSQSGDEPAESEEGQREE